MNQLNQLSLPSPVKLNLFLHILGKRDDGYHNLQTLFQFLDYGDHLSFQYRQESDIQLSPMIEGCPLENNLIWRAARLIQEKLASNSSHPVPGVAITLDKKSPIGGGLGGGSSNAATTLLALNQLWNAGLNLSQMAELGLKLGADVPFFVMGHSAWAEGIGEKLTETELEEPWYLVITPNCSVSTAEIFAHTDLTRSSSPIRIRAFLEGNTRNDCEILVRKLYPEIDKAMSDLGQFGQARLTGTGACIFARFEAESDAKDALTAMQTMGQGSATQGTGYQGFVAKGCNQSPLHKCLYKEISG